MANIADTDDIDRRQLANTDIDIEILINGS